MNSTQRNNNKVIAEFLGWRIMNRADDSTVIGLVDPDMPYVAYAGWYSADTDPDVIWKEFLDKPGQFSRDWNTLMGTWSRVRKALPGAFRVMMGDHPWSKNLEASLYNTDIEAAHYSIVCLIELHNAYKKEVLDQFK